MLINIHDIWHKIHRQKFKTKRLIVRHTCCVLLHNLGKIMLIISTHSNELQRKHSSERPKTSFC